MGQRGVGPSSKVHHLQRKQLELDDIGRRRLVSQLTVRVEHVHGIPNHPSKIYRFPVRPHPQNRPTAPVDPFELANMPRQSCSQASHHLKKTCCSLQYGLQQVWVLHRVFVNPPLVTRTVIVISNVQCFLFLQALSGRLQYAQCCVSMTTIAEPIRALQVRVQDQGLPHVLDPRRHALIVPFETNTAI